MQSVGLVFSGVLWLSLTLKRVKHSLLSAGRMPDSTGEGEWGGERACFPILLFAFPSISTLPHPHLLFSSPRPSPHHSSSAYATLAQFSWRRNVKEERGRERKGEGTGGRERKKERKVDIMWKTICLSNHPLHHHHPVVPVVNWCPLLLFHPFRMHQRPSLSFCSAHGSITGNITATNSPTWKWLTSAGVHIEFTLQQHIYNVLSLLPSPSALLCHYIRITFIRKRSKIRLIGCKNNFYNQLYITFSHYLKWSRSTKTWLVSGWHLAPCNLSCTFRVAGLIPHPMCMVSLCLGGFLQVLRFPPRVMCYGLKGVSNLSVVCKWACKRMCKCKCRINGTKNG